MSAPLDPFALWGLPSDVAPFGHPDHIDGDARATVTNARLWMKALRDGSADRAAVLERLDDTATRCALLAGAAERAGRPQLAADMASWFDGLAALVAAG